MKKLGAKGMKSLKFIHVSLAMLWMGSLASMWALSFWPAQNANEQMMALKALLWADDKVLVPSAIAILVTAIVYGLFTNYGFFKFRWITVKCILTMTLVLVGTFHFHPTVIAAIEALEQGGETALASDVVKSGILQAQLSGIQFTVIVIIVLLSIFRPWKKKNNPTK